MKFISLGNDCFSAAILKLFKLRDCSYMFDWSITNVNNIINILNNYSFNNCDELINNSLINFVHHSDLSYRKRCIERSFNMLKNTEEKVFVLTLKENFYKEQIIKLVEVLREKTNNFKLIIIDIISCSTNGLEKVENMSDQFEYWRLETTESTPFPSGTNEGIIKYKIFYKIFERYLNESLDNILSDENIQKEVSIYPIISTEAWNNL